jgi:hypothetical protein
VVFLSATFDDNAAVGGFYLTADGLMSNTTFYNVSFLDTPNREPLNVRVMGDDSNLSWTFASFNGSRSGDGLDSDPNQRVRWADTLGPNAPTSFSVTGEGDEEGDLELGWLAPVDNESGGPVATTTLRGGAWRIFHSTNSAERDTSSADNPTFSIPDVTASEGTIQTRDVTNLRPGSTCYFRLWAVDEFGNASPGVNTAGWVRVRTLPAISTFTISNRWVGIPLDSSGTIVFSKEMDETSLSGAVSLTKTRDNLGVSTNVPIGVTISPSLSENTYSLSWPTPLDGNSLYELSVSTSAQDIFGMTLSSSSVFQFTTLMGRTIRNVITEGLSGIQVDIPPLSLEEDGYLTMKGTPADINLATNKYLSHTMDSFRRPLDGRIVSLSLLDESDAPQSFRKPVTLTFPYTKELSGQVTGGSPYLNEETLSILWLDETHNVWVPLPSSVDTGNQTVTATASRISSFALAGRSDPDISEAYAFPSPYRASSGQPGITFSGIGQNSTIRLYTVSGKLVREIRVSGGTGQYLWDVTNEDGEPVESGVYYYSVVSPSSTKQGSLAVLK